MGTFRPQAFISLSARIDGTIFQSTFHLLKTPRRCTSDLESPRFPLSFRRTTTKAQMASCALRCFKHFQEGKKIVQQSTRALAQASTTTAGALSGASKQHIALDITPSNGQRGTLHPTLNRASEERVDQIDLKNIIRTKRCSTINTQYAAHSFTHGKVLRPNILMSAEACWSHTAYSFYG